MQKMIMRRRSCAAVYTGRSLQSMRRAGARGTNAYGLVTGRAGASLQLAGLQLGQMAVSRIETGKRVVPDFELPILAEVLRVDTDWLLRKE